MGTFALQGASICIINNPIIDIMLFFVLVVCFAPTYTYSLVYNAVESFFNEVDSFNRFHKVQASISKEVNAKLCIIQGDIFKKLSLSSQPATRIN